MAAEIRRHRRCLEVRSQGAAARSVARNDADTRFNFEYRRSLDQDRSHNAERSVGIVGADVRPCCDATEKSRTRTRRRVDMQADVEIVVGLRLIDRHLMAAT